MMRISFLLFTLLYSCALFRPSEVTELEETTITTEASWCHTTDYLNFVSDNYQLNLSFKNFAYKKSLSFVDSAAAWLLIQMNGRPDLVSVNSSVQFLIRNKGKTEFYSFAPRTDNSYSYLQAIELLLKNYGGVYSLRQIARLLDKEFSASFIVSRSLAENLQNHLEKFRVNEDELLKKTYLRGAHLLHFQDTLPKLLFSPIIRSYLKNKKDYSLVKGLHTIANDQKQITKCNLEKLSGQSNEQITYHPFALFDNKGNAIMAVANQSVTTLSRWKNTFLLNGYGDRGNAVMCLRYNKRMKQSILSFAINNHANQQIMSSFLKYSLDRKSTIKAIERGRVIKLSPPKRIIYEYERGSEQHYQKLLKKSLPIYSHNALGTIWSYIFDIHNGQLIQDPRTETYQSCMLGN